ncbi:hypothetical protein A3759_30165 [Thalassolituus sp. HI0120]|nr:hypothetical protein A3759_30165 [Thalassolituus sp. HI0120]
MTNWALVFIIINTTPGSVFNIVVMLGTLWLLWFFSYAKTLGSTINVIKIAFKRYGSGIRVLTNMTCSAGVWVL